MKTWQKIKDITEYQTLFIWRHRNMNRFYSKIFTWLLGGFVAGILTSLFFLMIALPDLSLSMARIVFFIVTLAGITSAFFGSVVNGLEYRLTDKGIIHVIPYCGIEALSNKLEPIRYFAKKYEFIPWTAAREFKDEDNEFFIVMKEKDPVAVGVVPVAMYTDVENNKQPVLFKKWFDKKNASYSDVLKQVVKKAREAKKNNQN